VHFTQVEITSPGGREREVWWLPVPSGRAKVGERITRYINWNTAADEEGAKHSGRRTEDWTITQVCTTLLEDDLPVNAKKATAFRREAQTTAFMTI